MTKWFELEAAGGDPAIHVGDADSGQLTVIIGMAMEINNAFSESYRVRLGPCCLDGKDVSGAVEIEYETASQRERLSSFLIGLLGPASRPSEEIRP